MKFSRIILVFVVTVLVLCSVFTVLLHRILEDSDDETALNRQRKSFFQVPASSLPEETSSFDFDFDTYSTDHNRIYCMVPSFIGQIKLWRAILDGYGKYCDVIKFFIDPLTFSEEQKYLSNLFHPEMSFKNYPENSINEAGFEFEATTSKGNSGKVVVVNMNRRKRYFNKDVSKEKYLIEKKFGNVEAYERMFSENFHDIGMCADKKPCRHIWEKVWRSFTYIRENDLTLADFFMKIDDDTFLLPANLKKYLSRLNLSPDESLYFGHQAVTQSDNIPSKKLKFISGVCSLFSRKAIEEMTHQYSQMGHEYGPRRDFPQSHGKCVDRDGATEERVTAKCLYDAGIEGTLAAEVIESVYSIEGVDSFYKYFVPDEARSANDKVSYNSRISTLKRKEFLEILSNNVEKVSSHQRYLPIDFDVFQTLPEGLFKAELVLPLGLPFSLTYKRKETSTSWYWNEKTWDRGDMLNGCSVNAFAFHGYKSSTRMDELSKYIFQHSIESLIREMNQYKKGVANWWYLYYIIQLKVNL